MRFLKEDLILTHYTWGDANKRAVFEGPATRRVFNRFNGEQVLYIINLCVGSSGLNTIADGRRIEKMILNELPLEPSSELSVYNWLMSVHR